MILLDAITRHLDALQVRNYTHRTRLNRAYQLRALGRFLAQCVPPVQEIEAITGDILAAFPSWLYHQPTPKGRARGVVNQNRILTGVRRFFAFLQTPPTGTRPGKRDGINRRSRTILAVS